MGDDVASLPAESSHDVLSPAPNGAPPLASAAAPAPAQPPRARPKLDLSSFTNPAAASRTGAGERRKGKSIFGVVLGTLNKAKVEDRQRNASEAVSFLVRCREVTVADRMRCAIGIFRPKSDRALMHDFRLSSLVSRILYGNKTNQEKTDYQLYGNKKT